MKDIRTDIFNYRVALIQSDIVSDNSDTILRDDNTLVYLHLVIKTSQNNAVEDILNAGIFSSKLKIFLHCKSFILIVNYKATLYTQLALLKLSYWKRKVYIKEGRVECFHF